MKTKFTLLIAAALFFAVSTQAQYRDMSGERNDFRNSRKEVYQDRDNFNRNRKYEDAFHNDRREFRHERYFYDRHNFRNERRHFRRY